MLDEATITEFSQLTKLACDSEECILMILGEIYDILECSIADFMEEYNANRQLPATPRDRLLTVYDFVCPKTPDNQCFLQVLGLFADIIHRRQTDIFDDDESNLLQKLQVLELYNYDTCIDDELLNLSFSFFGHHCRSIVEFSANFREFSLFLAKLDAKSSPGEMMERLLGHSVPYEQNFESSEEPEALEEIVDLLRLYYVPDEYMATRIMDYLLKLGEEARVYCAMNAFSSLLAAVLIKCSEEFAIINIQAWLDAMLRYVVFGSIAQPPDAGCLDSLAENIADEEPYFVVKEPINDNENRLASWLWRLFCERLKIRNTFLEAYEAARAGDAGAIEGLNSGTRLKESGISQPGELIGDQPELQSAGQPEVELGVEPDFEPEVEEPTAELTTQLTAQPAAQPRFVVTGHAVIQ